MLNKDYAELDTLYCFMMSGGAGLGEGQSDSAYLIYM